MTGEVGTKWGHVPTYPRLAPDEPFTKSLVNTYETTHAYRAREGGGGDVSPCPHLCPHLTTPTPTGAP
jgi:hypothetical protein